MLKNSKETNYLYELLNRNYTFHNIDIDLMIPQNFNKEEAKEISINQLNEGIVLMTEVIENFKNGKYAMFLHVNGKTAFVDYVDKKTIEVPLLHVFIDEKGLNKVYSFGFDKTGADSILMTLKGLIIGKIIGKQCNLMKEQMEVVNKIA